MRKFTVIIFALIFWVGLMQACGDETVTTTGHSGSPAKENRSEPFQVTIAVDPTWPPLEFLSDKGELIGFSIDYMTAAGLAAKFVPVFQPVPWDGIFDGLAQKRYDAICSSVSITRDRKAKMDFSEPYFRVRQALVVRKDATFRNLADVKGSKAGAQINTTGAFAIKESTGVDLAAYETVDLAMKDLLKGNLSAVVCDDPVAATYALVKQEFKGHLKIAAFIETDEVEYYGVAVKKGNTELLERIDFGIRSVKDTGRDQELLRKWIGQ